MPNPIVHFEITGKDGKKLQSFYSSLFQWNIDANNPMNYGLAMTREKDRGIDGGITQVQDGMPPYTAVYAAVENLEESLGKATQLGATVIVPITEIPGMVTFCLMKDPEGNFFGMIKS